MAPTLAVEDYRIVSAVLPRCDDGSRLAYRHARRVERSRAAMTTRTVHSLPTAVWIVAIAALCACGRGPTVYSGTLHTEAVEVGSKTGGRVARVLVTAGERVRAGQLLVRLEDGAELSSVAQARARLVQAQDQLSELLHGSRPAEITRAASQTQAAQATFQKVARVQGPEIAAARNQVRDARAAVRAAQAASVYADETYLRQASLGKTGDVAQQAVDQARSSRDQAHAALASARDRVRRAADQLAELERAQAPFDPQAAAANLRAAAATETLTREGPRPEEIAQARANVQAANAALGAARVALRETNIATPVAGVVEAIDLHPGDLLGPQATAASVDTQQDPYVRIYVPQRALKTFARGRRFIVRSDALPGETFVGVDEEHDLSAQFTPRDVQTAEDRAELVFGVKIRVHDPQHRLYGGTTVTVGAP
jgi:HlyD family secretion protein